MWTRCWDGVRDLSGFPSLAFERPGIAKFHRVLKHCALYRSWGSTVLFCHSSADTSAASFLSFLEEEGCTSEAELVLLFSISLESIHSLIRVSSQWRNAERRFSNAYDRFPSKMVENCIHEIKCSLVLLQGNDQRVPNSHLPAFFFFFFSCKIRFERANMNWCSGFLYQCDDKIVVIDGSNGVSEIISYYWWKFLLYF